MKYIELKDKDCTLFEVFSGLEEEAVVAGGVMLSYLPPQSRGYAAGSAWRLTDSVFAGKEISQEEAEQVFQAMQDSLRGDLQLCTDEKSLTTNACVATVTLDFHFECPYCGKEHDEGVVHFDCSLPCPVPPTIETCSSCGREFTVTFEEDK